MELAFILVLVIVIFMFASDAYTTNNEYVDEPADDHAQNQEKLVSLGDRTGPESDRTLYDNAHPVHPETSVEETEETERKDDEPS